MSIWYCTREDVKSATDFKDTARANGRIDRAIEAGSRNVENLLNRTFYPVLGTRYFDWPNLQRDRSWRLWLDANELVTLTSLTAGGTSIPTANLFVEPANYGPPYDRIETDLSTGSAFSPSNTMQRAIAVTGLWGYDNVTEPAGALTAVGINSSVTSITCTDSSNIGVGSLITINSEKLTVTEKSASYANTFLPAGAALLAQNSNVAVTVDDGTQLHVGEVIVIDAERMLITAISGNVLSVQRAWDGSTLATHADFAAIYAFRNLTVVRGVAGTTAASHLASASIAGQVYPGMIRTLTIAWAIAILGGETSGYVGTSDTNSGQTALADLAGLQKAAFDSYGRQARMRTV